MGILANSTSITMTSSTSDDTEVGFVVGERVTLSTNPTGTTYAWSMAMPSTSSVARSGLDDDDAASVMFTPDVAGIYTIVCTVDSTTTYVLRLSITLPAQASVVQALRLSPVGDTQVAAPAVGQVLYFSSTQNALVVKDANDDVFTVDVTAVV